MLIQPEDIVSQLKTHGVQITGVLHIGAHDCEERGIYYNWFNIRDTQMIWIDAIQEKVESAQKKGIRNVYQAVVTDKDSDTVTFNITNNVQSSSVLELGTHSKYYPTIKVERSLTLSTTTIDTFLKKHNLDASTYNFWNLDIQGAELLALRGGMQALKHASALYLEVNTEEVYKGCVLLPNLDAFLKEQGFTRIQTVITKHGWGDALYIRTH